MKSIIAAGLVGAALVLLPAFACTPAQSANTAQERAIARGTVETLETVWMVSAKTCIAVADSKQDQATADDCARYLKPARQAIVEAADLVDVWDDASQKNFPCVIGDAVAGITDARGITQLAGVKLPQVVEDGLILANLYIPKCVRGTDGGGQ